MRRELELGVTAFGLRVPKRQLLGCLPTPPKEDEIRICAQWIRLFCTPAVKVRKDKGSYYLKHVVERWFEIENPHQHHYIANGAFIVAAQRAGYTLKPTHLNSPNAYFNMKFSEGAFPRPAPCCGKTHL